MRLPVFSGAVLAAALLAPHALAQTCTSTLAATWDPVASTLAVTLQGAPANAPTMTFVGLGQGTTTMHGVTLGLTMPFYTLFFGFTDGSGALSASRVLTGVPSGTTAYLQSISMIMNGGMGGGGMGGGGMGGGGMGGGGSLMMSLCLSNVASVLF